LFALNPVRKKSARKVAGIRRLRERMKSLLAA